MSKICTTSKPMSAALAGFVGLAGALMAGCASTADSAVTAPLSSAPVASSSSPPAPPPPTTSAPPAAPTPSPSKTSAAPQAQPGRGFGSATLSIPSAGVRGVPIVSYYGEPDDGPGTEIQNRSLVAAAHGAWGGVAPGEVGNLILTGHRTSDGAPLANVPEMGKGELVTVTYKEQKYVYKITDRLWIDFRDTDSRNSQRLPVPGHYGQAATRPAIVLSTCATQEDNANGLSWRDEYHNPTHRIALVGYLVSS